MDSFRPSMCSVLRFGAPLLASSLVAVAAGEASGQTPYVVTHGVSAYSEVTTGGSVHTPVAYGFFQAWDEGSAAIPLPFPFTWYGNTYNTIHAYTNGFVSFQAPPAGAGLLGAPTEVPSTLNVIHDFIGGMWSDLEGVPPASEIRSIATGSPGSRVFTVQFKGLRDFGNSLSSVNFQIKLYEGTSSVDVVMGPNNGVTGASTVVENATGTEGLNLLAPGPTCGSACTCSPGACTSAQWPAGLTVTVTLPAGPELTGQIAGPRGAYPGTSFDANVTLRNIGLTPTGPFTYQVRLATSNTSTAGSTLLDTVLVAGGVSASATQMETRTLTMPAGLPVATYYLALVVDTDREVAEVIEANNSVFDSGGISTGPDLTGTVIAPVSSGPGETMDVTLTVRSAGAPVTSPIGVTFHLSTDAVLGAGDLPMLATMVTLPDGFEGTNTIAVPVPMGAQPSPPVYYVLAQIDDQNTTTEFNENNNVIASAGTVTLNGPELEAKSIDAGPFAFRGLSYPVTTVIKNNGGTTARNFSVCIVISRNLLISVISDPILVETPAMTLLPGEEARLTLEPVIDAQTSTGTWYLASAADCESLVTESLETNNIKRRVDAITIRDPAPDFVPLQVATATAAAAGETIPVSVRVANLGNRPGNTHVRIVVSSNPGITLDDTAIYDTTTSLAIPPPEEREISVWAQLPGDLPSGSYYIGAIADAAGAADEVYEDNNALGAGPVAVSGSNLAIVTPPPPNAVIGVPYVRRFSATGGTGAYAWSLSWENDRTPDGLTFDPALAELSGTPAPAAEGRSMFTVRVSSGGLSASRTYSLIITPPTIPLSVVSSRLPPALAGESYSVQLIAVGGTPPYQWSLLGAAPAGLGLSEGGELGGEPQLVGAYNFRVSVQDLAGARAESAISIDIVDATASVTITTADIATAVVGDAYSVAFSVAGGAPPYAWRLDVAEPIPGISFLADTAELVGMPTVAGEYPLIVEVRDQNGLIDRNAYVLDVLPPGELVITTGQDAESELPIGKIGEAYLAADGTEVRLRVVRRAGGEIGVVRWTIVDGVLPTGLGLEPTTGVLGGQPEVEGKYPFRVLVTNEGGDFAFAALAIEVAPAREEARGGKSDGCGCSVATEAGSGPHRLGIGRGAIAGSRGNDGGNGVPGRRALPLGAIFLALAIASLRRVRTRGEGARARRHGEEGRAVRGQAALRRSLLDRSIVSFSLLVGLALLRPGEASAQVVPYQVTQVSEAYAELTGGTQILPGLGDGNTVAVPLPFDFYLYGVPGNTLYVNANGIVAITSIGNGHHFPPSMNPDPSSFGEQGFVAGLWDDWCASPDSGCAATSNPGMGVYYAIDPTPGAGKITVEYRHVRHYGDSTTAGDINFKITLHEGLASLIELSYGTITPGSGFGGATDFNTRIGIEDITGTVGMWIGPCAGTTSCDAPQLASLPNQKIVVVADAGDDLTASSVAVPATGFPGLPASVSARVSSRHQAALGPTRVGAYIVPATATSTGSGTLVYMSAPITLAPFESRLLTFDAEIPDTLPVGQYRIAVVADVLRELAETDEQNNVAFSVQSMRVADRAPDFRILRVRPLDEDAAPGATVRVAYTADNFGNEPGTLELQAYLSSNQAITTTDLPLGALITANTVSRQVITATISVNVPAALTTGTYYVGFIADPNLAVAELSESNNVGRSGTPITVSASEVEILTDALPPGQLGQAYSAHVRAAGGNGTFAYRLSNGMLPRGMNFNAMTAEIFGVPLASGTFVLEFEAQSGAVSIRKTLTLEVLDPSLPLTVVTRDLPPAVLGEDYAVTIRAVGGVEPYRWRVSSGSLPEGIDLAVDGTLVGAPRSGGFAAFEIEVRDNASSMVVVPLSIEIRSPGNLTIVSGGLPEARLGEPYTQVLIATGGVEPLRWRAVTSPPAGLVVGTDGALNGVPEVSGAFRFRVEVTDAAGNVDTNQLTIDVVPVGRFGIATSSLPEGAPNTDYRALVKGEGGQTPYTWEIVRGEGSLPSGFEAEPSDGIAEGETTNDLVLSGRLEREGVWAFTVRLHDAQGRSHDRALAIVSRTPRPKVTNDGGDGGCVCVRAKSTRSAFAQALLLGVAAFASVRASRKRTRSGKRS